MQPEGRLRRFRIAKIHSSGGSAGAPAALLVMTEKAIDDFGRPAFNFYSVVKKFFKVRRGAIRRARFAKSHYLTQFFAEVR